jgi:septal ring factor EnvC (AmiA/AmiB activator)
VDKEVDLVVGGSYLIMKKRVVFIFMFLVLAFSTLLCPDEQAVSDKERLKRINEEIKRLKARYQATVSEEKSILSQLERLDVAIELKKTELARIEVELRINRSRQWAIRGRIARLNKKIEEEKRLLESKLVFIYKLGRLSYLRMALSLSQGDSFREGYYYISYLARRDKALIEDFREDIALFARAKKELAQAEKGLLSLRKQAEVKANEVADVRAEKKEYLARIRKEQRLTLEAISELMEASRKLEGLVAGLSAEGVPPSPPLSISHFRGMLRWPVSGKVVAGFGRVKHPKFDIYLVRKGVDIAALPGAPVYVVFDGKVIYADWFRGYGNLVIIDHGDNYWSFYGYNSKLLVKVDDYVVKGQPLALIGDSGFFSDSCLHFEIRHNGVPENPLNWLEKTKERTK